MKKNKKSYLIKVEPAAMQTCSGESVYQTKHEPFNMFYDEVYIHLGFLCI